jgi:voltage-gated potassium channel
MKGPRLRQYYYEELSFTGRQFWGALLFLFLLVIFAVVFYLNIESHFSGIHWSLIDSIFMAVMIITTIGQNVHPLSQLGEFFTIGYAITSLLLLALAVRAAARLVVGEQLLEQSQRRRRQRMLEQIKGHYIVCGFGRMGKETAQQLRRRGHAVVVVEKDRETLEQLRQTDILFVEGNASSDEVLKTAGVVRAKGLVAAADTDQDNLFIVLSARLLNPGLYIVARASREETVDKLQLAGANRVHSPYVVGGKHLAAAAVAPGVMDFLEMVLHKEDPDVEIAALPVPDNSPALGKPMLGSGVMREGGVMILAIMNQQGRMHSNPRPDTALQAGDSLIVMGTAQQITALQKILAG